MNTVALLKSGSAREELQQLEAFQVKGKRGVPHFICEIADRLNHGRTRLGAKHDVAYRTASNKLALAHSPIPNIIRYHLMSGKKPGQLCLEKVHPCPHLGIQKTLGRIECIDVPLPEPVIAQQAQ